MSIFSGVAGCVNLSVQIVDLLLTSKSNKHEFRSLQSAVQNIKLFLTVLPEEGITQQGNQVLRQLHAQLLQVHSLLSKVAGMGPLVSLLKAHHVREEFLRTNRDLLDTFGILARGEQLLRGVAVGGALQDQEQRLADISRDLRSCRSEFFSEEQAAQGRLLDVAAAGRKRAWPEELLQHKLLSELKGLPQLSELDSDALLEEFRALQMLALYNGPTAGAGAANNGDPADDGTTINSIFIGIDEPAAADLQRKKSKHVDEDLEEFLLQQVCAALAPSVAAASSQPLQAGPEPPTEYLCPIGQQVMVEPVLLIETGHSYEAANISRWLDMHDTCPLTGQTLHSKQLSSNRALKHLIADWAAAHGIALPAAPAYTPLSAAERLPSAPAAAALPAAAAAAAPSYTVLRMPEFQENNSSSRDAAERGLDQDQQPSEGPGKDPADLGSSHAAAHRGRKQGPCRLRCTRTRWAAAALALVVVLGAAVGIGVWAAKINVKAPASKPVASVSPALAADRSDVVGPSPSPSPLPDPAFNASASPSPLPSTSPSPDAGRSGTIRPNAQNTLCLSPSTSGQGVTLSACVAGDRSQAWEFLADSKLRSVGADKCLAVANDTCADLAPGCPGWAASGECQANPGFMVGDMPAGQTGKCMVSCKVCKPGTPACADATPQCAEWAVMGECQFNPGYMVGATQGGYCRASCKTCLQNACVDVVSNCTEWAAQGECQSNTGYMLGNGTQAGRCRASCKACTPTPSPAPLQMVDCKQAPSAAQWVLSVESYLRSVSYPEVCLAPTAPDASSKEVGLASCPVAKTGVTDAAITWRFV